MKMGKLLFGGGIYNEVVYKFDLDVSMMEITRLKQQTHT